MGDVVILLVHLMVTAVRFAWPGGLRSIVAESVLPGHPLLILNRGRNRAPNRRAANRLLAGLCTLFIRPARAPFPPSFLKPSTLRRLHKLLKKQKYRVSFASKSGSRPDPPGPKQELILAVVEMKQRNPGGFNFGT